MSEKCKESDLPDEQSQSRGKASEDAVTTASASSTDSHATTLATSGDGEAQGEDGADLEEVATRHQGTDPELGMTRTASGAPYSIYTTQQKRFIVFMASFAGLFSPISGTIYFPALNPLSEDLHVSNGLINLTLTSYMIFQGIAPTFMGDLADKAGRRPAYAACFAIYICANIGLALQDNYAALFVLRCLQSAGSSATIALASGVVGDISTAAERGSYQGYATAGSQLGPVVGPVIGGILAEFLGWRAIFWFLTILAVVYIIPFALVFPETSRNVVGDGSIPPQKWNITILSYLRLRRLRKESSTNSQPPSLRSHPSHPQRPKLSFPNPLSSVYILRDPSTFLLLLYNALLFCGFYYVLATIPPQYAKIYSFNTLQIGLSYIPFGSGCCSAAFLNGRLLDYNFRRISRQLGVVVNRKRQSDLQNFPIEKARLQVSLPLIYIMMVLLLIYGWVLDIRGPLAVSLILLFGLGYVITSTFNTTQTLLVDFHPSQPSTATAANNLLRCLLGAGALAVIDPMIQKMGIGGTFSLLVGVLFLFSPVNWALYLYGVRIRQKKYAKQQEKERTKSEARAEESGESGMREDVKLDQGEQAVPTAAGGVQEAAGLAEVEKEIEKDVRDEEDSEKGLASVRDSK